jgi:hypothetical protein
MTWSSMTSPTPICTVNEDECARPKSIWNAEKVTTPLAADIPIPCRTHRACSSDSIGPCSLDATGIKIYFWPTPAPCRYTTNLLLATQPTSTSAHVSESPVMKVIDGLTATSPSIYISIPSLYGRYYSQPRIYSPAVALSPHLSPSQSYHHQFQQWRG